MRARSEPRISDANYCRACSAGRVCALRTIMRFVYAASTVALVGACYKTAADVDTTGADSAVVSAPAMHDSTPRSDTGNVPAGGNLQLRTDKSSYRAGENMTLTFVNPTRNRYTYNPCTRTLEREVGGAWRKVEEMRMCTMIAHILEPRSTRVERTELTEGLEPGRYRVIVALTEESTSTPSRSVNATSAPITVTR
jgi:hypothetical protein